MRTPQLDDLKTFSPEEMTKKIAAKEPFSFLRYGDGECGCAYQEVRVEKGNCDGHHFYRDLGKALEQTLLEPLPAPAVYGMQSMMLRRDKLREPLHKWLEEREIDIDWHQSDVLHYANRDGKLAPFIRALKKHGRVVLIGNRRLLQGFNLFEPFACLTDEFTVSGGVALGFGHALQCLV